MRRPAVYLALAVIIFISAGYYLLGIEFGSSDALAYLKTNVKSEVSSNSADPSFRVSICGRVQSAIRKSSDYHKFTVKLTSINGVSLDSAEPVLLSVYDELEGNIGYEDYAGRILSCEAVLTLPAQQRNPNCFDYRLYLKTKGIYLVGTCESSAVSLSPYDTDRISNYLSVLKAKFIEYVRKSGGDDAAALASAMIFGDKSQIDDDLYEAFQKNGTAHILAVSGIHIGIIYALISFLWRGRKRGIFSVVTVTILLCYSILADFSPSVMRAVIMIILHIISKLLHRRYDMLSAAAVTAIVMLLNNPMQLFSSGFQLSFGAVAVLSALIPVMSGSKAGKTALIFCFQLAMAPYTAYLFNYFSLSGFIMNPAVILLADMMVPAGIILLIASGFLTGVVVDFGGSVFSFLSDTLIEINEFSYMPGVTSFDVVSPPLWSLWVFYGLFFICLSEDVRIKLLRKRYKVVAACIIAVLCASIIAGSVGDSFDNCRAIFVDVGQGDCLLIKDVDGKNYLVDGGGKENYFASDKSESASTGNQSNYDIGKKLLKPLLLKNGVSHIDAAFVTHLHTDHYDGIRSLAKLGIVDRICVYEANKAQEDRIIGETGLSQARIIYAKKGDSFSFGDGCSIEILWPEHMTPDRYEAAVSADADENDISMVMRVNVDNVSILMTGDIDEEGERAMVSVYGKRLKSDVLKVAHHGSKYSSCEAFLDAVSPEVAVIQVGKNRYGHPSGEVLEKLKDREIPTYRNDLDGAVGVEINDGMFKNAIPIIRNN